MIAGLESDRHGLRQQVAELTAALLWARPYVAGERLRLEHDLQTARYVNPIGRAKDTDALAQAQRATDAMEAALTGKEAQGG
jgi:hypothetical protein